MSQIPENKAQCREFWAPDSAHFVSKREGILSQPPRVVVVFPDGLPQNCRASVTGYGHGAIPSG
jgi:hypothetical protein